MCLGHYTTTAFIVLDREYDNEFKRNQIKIMSEYRLREKVINDCNGSRLTKVKHVEVRTYAQTHACSDTRRIP